MSELRHDPIQARWVIIAAERQSRGSDFLVVHSSEKSDNFCPFCPGAEAATPKEITAVRSGDGGGASDWRVRVVPNRYPALATDPTELNRSAAGIYDRMNGVGAHEVIIETPRHIGGFADYSIDQLFDILTVYRARLTDLMRDHRLRYILIFKNHGEGAGATLSHPHSQLIATPITPRTVAIELDNARRHYQIKERCLICDILQQEIAAGERVIYDDGTFITLAPYASRFPFELFLAPRFHRCCFSRTTDEELIMLAQCLKDTFGRLKRALNDPPFNFVLHTAPNATAKPVRTGYWVTLEQDYHWHLEIIPRLTKMAGFEWGTGFYINPTPPEDAARYMREVVAG